MQMGRTSSVVLGPRRKGLVLAHGTGGGVPLGALVLNGTLIVLNSKPIQKAS